MKVITHRFFDCFWNELGTECCEMAYCGAKHIESYEDGEISSIFFADQPSCKECEDAYALYVLGELP